MNNNTSKSLEYAKEALKLSEQIGDTLLHAISVTYMGHVYNGKGDYSLSLEYFLKGNKLFEILGDEKGITNSYNAIGNVYAGLGETHKALKYYYKSLNRATKNADSSAVAVALIGTSNQHNILQEYSTAINQLDRASKIFKINNKKFEQAVVLTNLGDSYLSLKRYEDAISNFNQALAIFVLDSNYYATGLTYLRKGKAFHGNKKYQAALAEYEKAIELLQKINAYDNLKTAYEQVVELYTETNDFKKAYEYHLLYVAMKDSVMSNEKEKKILELDLRHEFEQEQKIMELERQTAEAFLMAKSNQQKYYTYTFIAGFFIMIIIAGLIFKNNRSKQKSNKLLKEEKSKVENQKDLLEEKNKSITDSIHYAKRIQDAILKSQDHESHHLPEHFILFKPKDIVSGDFYWASEKKSSPGKASKLESELDEETTFLYLAAADCTGHGVPGALLTMLGTSFLNEINSKKELYSPAVVLDKLKRRFIKELSQTTDYGGSSSDFSPEITVSDIQTPSISLKDGMDIALIKLNLITKELEFAGANNPLYLIKQGNLTEIKGNKQSIGYSDQSQAFTNHKISLNKGDFFYIFSDGFADQFGGIKGKKMKYAQLKELLLTNIEKSMAEQKQILNSAFEDWKGELEQVDDVCIIGVKI
ncbi:MAG: tetratricopeptide repeat protein [Bacteroidota bacterium]|nr:tetratricopeptide repeat protein [Bacteroidota bacterium]